MLMNKFTARLRDVNGRRKGHRNNLEQHSVQ